jgi:hypothetical protein
MSNVRLWMNHRQAIESTFLGMAFMRPLFYSWRGGLRFALSEGDSPVDQFLTAHRKALEICEDIFAGADRITVCLRAYYTEEDRSYYRQILRELSGTGIKIPRERSVWRESLSDDEADNFLCVSFQAPSSWLPRLLWCALSSDLGIHPRPRCSVYLFNLDRKLLAFPYDDRGMDVVGPNFGPLLELYRRHSNWLLNYDREEMRSTFEQLQK